MGKQFTLMSSDSFKLGAYRADPAGPAKGGIVVIQEIFGVNHHIRAVCDRLGRRGLCGAGAGGVRSSAAELRMRLHARRDRQCAQVRRQSRLGRDAARRAGVDRRAQEGRAGRHHGLLHGRHDLVPGGLQAQRAVRRRLLLRRPDRQECRREAEGADCRCISAKRTRRSR